MPDFNKPFLDQLFAKAEQIMWKLSKEDGYFTNYEFIRHSAQEEQREYVHLLATVLDHRDEDYLFNIAHENMGGMIAAYAKRFGDEAVIYSGTEQVVQPS